MRSPRPADDHAERLPGLDLLRSVAIVWVMLFHSFLLGGLGPDWAWLSRYGWMGVDLFFVLSGFLIGLQVLAPLARGQQLSFSDFYMRRAFRILPAYWVVLLLYLWLPPVREATGMEPWWKFVTFLLNISIDYDSKATFSHAWSLCVEEHFYLLFPLLAVAMLRRPAAWKFALLCAAVVLGGVGLRAAIWSHNAALDPNLSRNWFVEDIYYPTWNRLDGLLCGVVLATWKTFRPQAWLYARRYANAVLCGGVLLMAFSFWLFQNRVGLLANAVGWPVLSLALGLLVFAGAGRDNLLGRWKIPCAGWLAAASYSLYLTHKAAYHWVLSLWGTQLADAGFVAFLVYASAAVIAGAAIHHAVERPFLRLRAHWAKGRRSAVQVAQA